MRPSFISKDQFARYKQVLADNKFIDEESKRKPEFRELMFSGFWLLDELKTLGCDDDLIFQLHYTHGAMTYSLGNPWQVAQDILSDYKEGKVEVVSELEVNKEIDQLIATAEEKETKLQN